MSVPDWRQPQGLRGRPGFKPTCRAEFAAWTASGRAGLGAGGRQQDLAELRDDAPSKRSATKHRRYGGSRRACGACLGAGGRRQGQGGLSGRAKLRPVGGCRGACKAGLGSGGRRQGLRGMPRCRWAAAGPGLDPRRRAKRTISNQAPAVWRPPRGLRGLAAVPEGGGRAWPGFEIDHSEPQARVWRSRGRAAALRHTQRPNPTRQAPRRPGPTVPGKPVVPQAPPESQNSS